MEIEHTTSKDGKRTQAPPPPPPPPPPLPLPNSTPQKSRTLRRTMCMVSIAFILGIFLILLIVGLTVFKVKRPTTTVHSIALQDLQLSLDTPRLKVYLNISLDVHLSIQNQNKIGFKFTNSYAFLKYRGQVVGEVPIPAAKISAHKTLNMDLTVTVLADRLLSNSDLYSDVISGTLPFSTYTKISGKVDIVRILKIHVASYTSCDIIIDVKNRTVSKQTCHSKTKL